MSLSVGYATYRYGLMEMGGLLHVAVGGILALGFFYIKRWVLEYREARETKD